MKLLIKNTILLLCLSISLSVQAQKAFDERALGQWEGNGTLFGMEAQFSMHWEKTLGDKFLKLTFQNRFKDQNWTERVMNAQGYYNTVTGKGQWFDSRGQNLPLLLEIDKKTLKVFWGDESTEQGKTIYVIVGKKMAVEDYVMKDGMLNPFGKAEYVKVE
ncbi:MAG: hypothetical protein ACR2MM_06735 [Flavobacteriaceae bacterium]